MNREGVTSNREGVASNREGVASNREGVTSNREGVTSGTGLGVEHVVVSYPVRASRAERTTTRAPRATRAIAVDDVTLTVAAGEVVALLGPSGCGKSSLLRAIAGLEPLDAGRVTWDDDDVANLPVHRRGFGLMFQDGQLFPHRDVGGNVAYGLRGTTYGGSRAARTARVTDMLDLVGLAGYERRAIATLSGGQAQRVALARSLAPAPRLLLLDEPLSSLDRRLREELAADVGRVLREAGTTALYVTHDHDEALTVADRVGVMIEGRLRRIAGPADLLQNPGADDVAAFLGL